MLARVDLGGTGGGGDDRSPEGLEAQLFLLLTCALRMLVVQSHISSSSVQDRQLWVNRGIQEMQGVLALIVEGWRRGPWRKEDRAGLGRELSWYTVLATQA